MFLYYFITFIVLTVPFNLSIYMEALKFKNPDISGTYIAVFFLAMTLPGLFINNIINWFRNYTNVYSAIAITLGFILLLVKGGPVPLTVGVILIGLGYGCMQPVIYDKTSTSTVESHATFALALVMAMNYMAIITYPFILEILQDIFSCGRLLFPVPAKHDPSRIICHIHLFQTRYKHAGNTNSTLNIAGRKTLRSSLPYLPHVIEQTRLTKI